MTKTTDVLAYGNSYLDINISKYPFSDEGIQPEVELLGGQYELVAGGSAINFCRALQNVGVQTSCIGMRGDDSFGAALESLVTHCGIKARFITLPNTTTNISYNMTNKNGKHIMLVAGTANQHLSAKTLLPILEKELCTAKMIYVGGLYKQTRLQHAFDKITVAAKVADTTIVIDHGRVPSDVDPVMIESVKQFVLGADYYFTSREEFLKTWRVGNIAEGLRLLERQAPHLNVAVKNGDDGAYLMENGRVIHIQAVKIETISNLTGAGDTFNAGVISSILKGDTMRLAVTNGCKLAAEKISRGVTYEPLS